MYKMASMLLANPAVMGAAKPLVGGLAQEGAGAIGGGLGKLIGGKKGAKVGKKIGKAIGGIGRKLFGLNTGGKVRKTPMIIAGYNAGGVVARPMVRPLPRPRKRK